MEGGNQLLFVLQQRHDELASQKDNVLVTGKSQTAGRARRNPLYEAMDTHNRAAMPARRKRSPGVSSRRTIKKRESFAYVSPFVKQAADKALKRAMANARLLPTKNAKSATNDDSNISNVSIRSDDAQKKRGKPAVDWNFETKAPSLFDPKLQKQEIFRRQPRIPEVRLQRSGGGLGVGTSAAANAVADALGLTSALDDTDLCASQTGEGCESTSHTSVRDGEVSSNQYTRSRELTRRSSVASVSSTDYSASPDTSASPPRHRRAISPKFSRTSSGALAPAISRPSMVTRSVSPIDERLIATIIQEENRMDDPVDKLFQYGTQPIVPMSRAELSRSSGSNADMLSSMAQVLTAVKELVQSIKPNANVSSTPWTKRRPTITTPGRSATVSEFQLRMVEETLQDMHQKELQSSIKTAKSGGKESTTFKGIDNSISEMASKIAPSAPPPPLTKAAIADLLLSKIQAFQNSEMETLLLLQKPPAASSSATVTYPAPPRFSSSSSFSSSSIAPIVNPVSLKVPSSSSAFVSEARRDATRLPRFGASTSAVSSAAATGDGVLTFTKEDAKRKVMTEGLSEADADYFYQLQLDDERARSALQLAAPSPHETHETAITSMMHADMMANIHFTESDSLNVNRKLTQRGAEQSFIKGLFSPSLSDRARASDHIAHVTTAMQQRRVKALAHLPNLIPSVAFVNNMETYNKRLKIAQELKDIPFDARGISSCYVGDRFVIFSFSLLLFLNSF